MLQPEAGGNMRGLPTGTVTFLFTDIEGSTNLARALGEGWVEVLDQHHAILRTAIRETGGIDVRTEGDAFFAVFPKARDAVAATASAQRKLVERKWPAEHRVRVRMGMHTGEGRLSSGEYVGLDVHLAARIAGAAHGGQVLLSEATRSLVQDGADGVSFKDLGRHRLKDFEQPQRIFQLVIDGLTGDFPPIRSLEIPSNLPVELTSFIGREREVQEVAQLLRDARLVTLTGPGGTGKTRLGLRVAAAVADRFPDGVYFVDLSPISDPRLVPSVVAQALRITEDPAVPVAEKLKHHLQPLTLLLLIDNFEHLTSAGDVVASILHDVSKVSVLVTSRVVLNLYGEVEYGVPPLALPALATASLEALLENAAVSLFAARAAAANHAFRLTSQNAAAVAEICARLDGLPLAIELAAARAKLLSPEGILERLANRLPLLTGGPRDLPERQRTLRGAIDWSVKLLSEPETRLLGRLSVFAGGWELGAAQAISNPDGELGIETLDGLAVLRDGSLIRQAERAEAEQRFSMLETIRDYASDLPQPAGDARVIRYRHAEHFASFAEAAEPHLETKDQAYWLDRCEREHDNLRGALRWSIDNTESQLALRTAAALWRFWYQRGHLREGTSWLDEALALPGPRNAARARGHGASGGIAYWRTDYAATKRHYEAALKIWRELGDRRGEMEGLYNLGFVPLIEGDVASATPIWEQTLFLARELGDQTTATRSIANIGFVRMMVGKPAEAVPLLEQAQATWRELGNRLELADSTGSLGAAYRMLGELEKAAAYYQQALQILQEAGNLPMTTAMLDGLTAVASAQGNHVRALRLRAASTALKEAIGGSAPVASVAQVDVIGPAEQAIGHDAVESALAEGRRLAVDEAIALALRA